MKKEKIDSARMNYDTLFAEQEKLKKIREELLNLEKDSKVKRYIELKEEINGIVSYDNNEILMKSFDLATHDYKHESNKILVYMGKYFADNDCSFYINCGGEKSNYYKYMDLETSQAYFIKFDERDNFEKNNKIIYMNGKSSEEMAPEQYEEGYKRLKLRFLKNLLFNLKEQTNTGVNKDVNGINQDIFVYMGSYSYEGSLDYMEFYGDNYGNFYKYKNLITEETMLVDTIDNNNFKSQNMIVYLKLNPIKKFQDRKEDDYNEAFDSFKSEWFQESISNNKILKKQLKRKICDED